MSNTRSLIIGIFVVIVIIVTAFVVVRFIRGRISNNTSTPPKTNTQNTNNTTDDITPTKDANLPTSVPSTNTGTTPISGTVSLSSKNGSKETGKAVLQEVDGSLQVVLTLSNAPVDTLQPAHIYQGTCDKLGAVLYPLAFPFNGESVTTLETTKNRLMGQKPLVIGVLTSESDQKLAACGSL